MTTRMFILVLLTLTTTSSCTNGSNNKTVTTNKSNWIIDKEAISKYKWTYLLDTTQDQVYYLQLNFLNFPEDSYIGKNILYFADSLSNKFLLLHNQQRIELYKLITDSSNFAGGDCGTFHLNAGFVIAGKDKIKATIDIGCAYNQWNFNPENSNSKYGALNEKGFRKMEKIIDKFNLINKK